MINKKSLFLSPLIGLFLVVSLWSVPAQAVFYFKPYSDDINAMGIKVTAAPGITTKGYIYLANEDEGNNAWYEINTVDAELKPDGSYNALNSEKNSQKQMGLWAKPETNKVNIDNAQMKLLEV